MTAQGSNSCTTGADFTGAENFKWSDGTTSHLSWNFTASASSIAFNLTITSGTLSGDHATGVITMIRQSPFEEARFVPDGGGLTALHLTGVHLVFTH